MLQAPAEQFTITRREEKARSGEDLRSPDECFEIFVAFSHGMPHESDQRRVATDAAGVFHNHGSALFDRMTQFLTSVMAMNFMAEMIASIDIAAMGRTDRVTGDIKLKRRPLQ